MISSLSKFALRFSVFLCLIAVASWIAGRINAEQLPIKIFSTKQGLAHERVENIYRDSHGFMWFSTNDGLSRFDGQNFVSYSPRDGLAHSRVSAVIEGHDGIYWVATGNGLSSFVPSRDSRAFLSSRSSSDQSGKRSLFTNYRIGGDKVANFISTVFEDSTNRLWLGTQGGLYLMNRQNENSTPGFQLLKIGHPAAADNLFEITRLLEDGEGSLWIGSIFGLARRLPDGRFIHYTLFPSEGIDAVRAMILDKEGRLWIGHQSGLLIYKPEAAAQSKPGLIALEKLAKQPNLQNGRLMLPDAPGEARWYTTADGLADQRVRAICQTFDGHIWLGTPGGGVAEFDGNQFRNFTPAQGVNRLVYALGEDSAGNLWVGSQTNGVTRISRRGFLTYHQSDGLGVSDVFSIFEDREKALIVVNNDWFINRLSGNRFVPVSPNLPKEVKGSSSGNRPMIQAQDGEWWVATGNGLFRFPAVKRIEELASVKPKTAYFEKDGLASSNVSRLFEDSRGDVWISSYTPPITLTKWERATGKLTRYGVSDGIPPNNWPHVFAEDKAGNVWIGLHYGELMRIRNGKFEIFHVSDGVPESMIQGMYCDSAGRLWVATGGGGAARIDNPASEVPRFVVYKMEQGLSSNNQRCFTEDRWGRIYIGTARGVDRLDLTTGQIKHFTSGDGLSNGEVVAAFTDNSGDLWFGTREGLSRLLLEERDAQIAPPRVLISGIMAGGKPQPVPELGLEEVRGLELNPDQSQIQIEFFGFSFAAGDALRYQYKIEGVDRDWSAPSEQRTVTASLSPGPYRFMVRAVGAEGKTSEKPAIVSLKILPPFYRRWWFIALTMVSILASGYYAYRLRLKRLIEIERVRTRIATDLHDDIGASLSRVAILSEVVKQQNLAPNAHNGGSTEQSVRMLTEIADSARGLVDSMSDIVWSIDPRRDDLGHVITRTRQFASDVLESQNITWQFTAPQEIEKTKLGPDERRHLFLILKEAINNIARHANCRNVIIKLSLHGHQLLGEIEDDGQGFTPQPMGTTLAVLPKSRGGNGLGNMQARAVELGGELKVDSAPGQGTRLSLSIPMKK